MSSKTLEQFEIFIDYVQSLKVKFPHDETWTKPISPGKWSLKELICHLWYWDVYSLERIVPFIKPDAQLPAFPDLDAYNRTAMEKLTTFPDADSLIREFTATRKKLVESVRGIYDPEIRFEISKEKRPYSIDRYIKIFVHHDEHHKKQIESMVS